MSELKGPDFKNFTGIKPAFAEIKAFFGEKDHVPGLRSIMIDGNKIWKLSVDVELDSSILIYVFDAYTQKHLETQRIQLDERIGKLRAKNNFFLRKIKKLEDGNISLVYVEFSDEKCMILHLGKDFVVKRFNLVNQRDASEIWEIDLIEKVNFLMKSSDDMNKGYCTDADVIGDVTIAVLAKGLGGATIFFVNAKDSKMLRYVGYIGNADFLYRSDGKLFMSVSKQSNIVEFV